MLMQTCLMWNFLDLFPVCPGWDDEQLGSDSAGVGVEQTKQSSRKMGS